jgi:hypothetical protein
MNISAWIHIHHCEMADPLVGYSLNEARLCREGREPIRDRTLLEMSKANTPCFRVKKTKTNKLRGP